MIKNSKAKIIIRAIWLFTGVFATILTLTDHISVFGGDAKPFALFFTSWSVWLATLAAAAGFASAVQKEEKTSQWILLLKFCAVIMIIATFIVASFVLPDKIWKASYWTLGGTFKHFLLPIITVADTVLFDEKDSYKVYYPFAAVVIPLLYWAAVITRFCIARNAMGGVLPANLWDAYYPYGFTNIDNGHSLAGLIKLLAGILVGLLAIGYGFFFGKKNFKKQ